MKMIYNSLIKNSLKGFLFIMLFGISLSAFPKEIHVSSLSNTNGNGSEAAPFNTIQAAALVAKPGDKVIIHAGTYRETVTPAFSGTANARITYMPYNEDVVIVDGSDPITGWTLHNDKIYRAPMKWDLLAENQIFVDGTMVHLARWPNVASEADPFFTFASYSKAGAGSIKGKIVDNSLPKMPDDFFKGCIMWGNFGVKWTAFGTRILTSKGNTLTYSGGDDVHRPFAAPYSPLLSTDREMYFLAGKYELLDAPNEWYLDQVKDSLYLWVKDGVDSNLSVRAKRRTLAFNLNGKSHITVKNIHVFASTITMNNTNYCVLDGINAKYVTHHSMDGVGLYALRFQQLKDRCGINFSGQSDSVKNCIIKYSAGTGLTVGPGSNHVVDNNDIQYCNYVNSYCEGINSSAETGENVSITRNKVWYAGGPLINAERGDSWKNNKGHFIAYNDLAFGEQLGDDRGGLNGSGYEVCYNWVHDIGRGLGSGIVPGLYTDVSRDYSTYHHNVIWNLVGNTTAHILINNTGNPANGNQEIYIYNNTGWGTGWGQTITAGLWQTIITDKNNLCNPPSTTFIDASKFDLRLRPTAANAIDKAIVIDGITDGFAGIKPDLGAYEFGATNGGADWKAGNNVKMYYDGKGQSVSANPLEMPSFRMYPNPANSVLYFDNIAENSEIQVIDFSGKTVLTQSLTNKSINVSELPNGLYLVKVRNNEEKLYQKLIKK